jgi:ABC-2 type transport system permease protein
MVGVMVALIGNVIGDRSDLVQEEDGSYVAFILVGLAFMDVLLQGLGTLPRAIHDQQQAGTLEPMLLAPISNMSLLTSFWLFRFLLATLRMISLLAFGIIALGFWHSANPLSVALILVPAELTFLGIGAISAGFVVLFKEGDPVRFAYTGITTTLGGAFFPVTALPGWLQIFAAIVPLTHALSGIREGLNGGSVADVMPQFLTLVAMAAVIVPIGLWTFGWALKRARREGTLGEY